MSLLKAAKLRLPNIILFGAPGVGKGTYGTMLEKDLKFKRVSTGDQIRAFLKNPNLSPEMQEIKLICQTGGLVNDKMVLDIIVDSLREFDSHDGVLFDGFPRNIKQLELFSERFDMDVSYVVNCLLNEDILIEKLAGRRVCNDCGFNYNICEIERDGYSMKPLLPKHGKDCDCCGGKLVQREDDKEHTIRHRLNIYKQETEPLLHTFRSMGMKVMDFEPKRGVDDYPSLFKDIKGDYLNPMQGLIDSLRLRP
jgi:adenylate kinase